MSPINICKSMKNNWWREGFLGVMESRGSSRFRQTKTIFQYVFYIHFNYILIMLLLKLLISDRNATVRSVFDDPCKKISQFCDWIDGGNYKISKITNYIFLINFFYRNSNQRTSIWQLSVLLALWCLQLPSYYLRFWSFFQLITLQKEECSVEVL